MRSAAHFRSHPIHPMLIPFPIAFLVGGVGANVVGRVIDSEAWWRTGGWLVLAGIIAALIAAAPGVVDYLCVVPPNSSAKMRATYHMIVNSASVTLFAIAWLVRGHPSNEPSWPVLILEIAALALLSVGGWMGGTLSYRNHIGVEHRYANAGKWSETTVTIKPGEPVAVAKVDDLKVDQMKLIRTSDGERIVLARTEQGYVAFDDHCTHRGGSLADGVMICGRVQCLWHGSQFDCRTGEVKAGPAEKPIPTYRVNEKDGEVRLVL